MIRALGGVLVCCGFALGGCSLAGHYRKRVRYLNALLLMLSMTQSRLRYLALPVEELLDSLQSCASLRQLSFIPNCLFHLRAGVPFAQAWEHAVHADETLRRMPETAALVSALGATLGAVDLQGQLDHCAQCAAQLERQLQAAEQQLARAARLFPPLGLLLGAFSALMLFS